MLLLMIVLIIGITYAVKKERKKLNPEDQIQSPRNNLSRNKDFVTSKTMILFGILLSSGPILSALAPRIGNNNNGVAVELIAYLLLHLVHPFVTLMVIPLKLYFSNPDFRKFALEILHSLLHGLK